MYQTVLQLIYYCSFVNSIQFNSGPTLSAPPSPPLPPTGNPPAPSSCGDRPSSSARIVGGHETVKNSIPWQAMLRTRYAQFCGGSLIHKQWVLTAAHCVDGSSPNDFRIWYIVLTFFILVAILFVLLVIFSYAVLLLYPAKLRRYFRVGPYFSCASFCYFA